RGNIIRSVVCSRPKAGPSSVSTGNASANWISANSRQARGGSFRPITFNVSQRRRPDCGHDLTRRIDPPNVRARPNPVPTLRISLSFLLASLTAGVATAQVLDPLVVSVARSARPLSSTAVTVDVFDGDTL